MSESKISFREFLNEYSFAEKLPQGVQKIYAQDFTEKDKTMLQDLDDVWHEEQHGSGYPQLVSYFFTGKKYKLGEPKKPFKLTARNFRDRMRMNVDVYPNNDDIKSGTPSIDVHTLDVKYDNLNQLKRIIVQKISDLLSQ